MDKVFCRPAVFRSLFVFDPARAVAHIAFAIARVPACFADTAFSGSFNPNTLFSHSYHRQQRNCYHLPLPAPLQFLW
jgi:hypothetical protein